MSLICSYELRVLHKSLALINEPRVHPKYWSATGRAHIYSPSLILIQDLLSFTGPTGMRGAGGLGQSLPATLVLSLVS